jgi:cyclophilin family peptidyl-prolyl cis-trans isomerase
MALPWLSHWLTRKLHRARRPARTNRAADTFLQLEELEPRWVPSNYYLVRGSSAAQTTLVFQWNNRGAIFNNELGVYKVNDDAGDVTNSSGTSVAPTESGYAAAALANAQVVFSAGQGTGAANTLSFAGDTLLGFYLVQNGTTAEAKANNTSNLLGTTGNVTFFSFEGANPDGFNHVTSALYGDGSARISWNDQTGGGSGDFNAAVFTVSVNGGSGASLPGLPGQTVPVTFSLSGHNGTFQNEVGVFQVDSINGSIGGLLPGQAGWAQAALTTGNPQVIFARGAAVGTTTTVNLPAGGLFGLYLVQDSTTANFQVMNATDQAGTLPMAFFSFTAANPDQFQHLRWQDTTHFAWEDQTGGGDKDFTDVEGTVSVGAPQGTPISPPPPPAFVDQGPPTVTTPINNVSVARNAVNTTLDLAGNFGDPDIVDNNTTVSIQTSSGPINLNLFDKTTPRTVANFVDYIENGAYTNGIFNRLALNQDGTPFVLQGGAYQFLPNAPQGSNTLQAITTLPPIQNEPGVSNVKGTIAMAKSPGDPNSATSQFFFNLGNNSSNLDQQNGGFTAFGELADQASFNTLTTLQGIPTQDQSTKAAANGLNGGDFTNTPLFAYTGTNFPKDTTAANFEMINSITIHQNDALTYQVVNNSNPGLVTATVSQNRMTWNSA